MSLTAHNLCLHYVDASSPKRLLAVSEIELHACIDRELAKGREAVSLADYVRDAAPPAASAFSISFDDAHSSVLRLAAPLLVQRKIPFTLFVPVLWVGTSDEWLSWDELRALRDQGVTIGAHSMSHQRFSWRLYDEDEQAYQMRLYDECAQSKESLERELGLACDLFAYPYGEDPAAARAAVRRAGYKAAFTVRGDTEWDGDVYSIPRVDGLQAHQLVRARSDEPLPISVIVPARDRIDILRETLGRLAAQSYPEEKYEVIVVDDGSTEDLSPIVNELPKGFSLLRHGSNDGVFRAGQARNAGARIARYSVLSFLDADIAVPQDYLWALDWIHQRHSDAAVCGYLSGYNLHDLGHVHTVAEIRGVAALEHVPVIPDRSREPAARACLDNADWLSDAWKLCYTGNLSVPRDLFERVKGFATEFEGWGLEDIDFGYRLRCAKATFFFSRFALGYHLTDPNEGPPRNPFRRAHPNREDFAGYLLNLAKLVALHPSDDAIADYRARALADIDETCGRPKTVGVEFGGSAKRRAPFHLRVHRTPPGGIPTHELLDRVAYAQKVCATSLWLLGGEPAEHPGFFDVLDAARRGGIKHVGMQSQGHAFAEVGLAKEARARGLGHVTVLWAGAGEAGHDVLFGRGAYALLLRGIEELRKADIHLAARVVLTSGSDVAKFAELQKALEMLGLSVDEVAADLAVDRARAAATIGREVSVLAP